jgi:hypothetical protein
MGSASSWLIVLSVVVSLGGLVRLVVWLARQRHPGPDVAGVYCRVTEHGAGVAGSGGGRTTARVANKTRFPVSSVRVMAWEHGRRSRAWRLVRQDRWMTGRCLGPAVRLATLVPAEEFECELPAPSTTGIDGDAPPVTLEFQDGGGRGHRWIRWPDGKVTRLYPSVHWLQQRRRARLHRRIRELS